MDDVSVHKHGEAPSSYILPAEEECTSNLALAGHRKGPTLQGYCVCDHSQFAQEYNLVSLIYFHFHGRIDGGSLYNSRERES